MAKILIHVTIRPENPSCAAWAFWLLKVLLQNIILA